MTRCEEIFRQICWLEERFWPTVDSMGEGGDTSRLGPSLGPMAANGMSSAINGSMQMGTPQINGLPNGVPSGNMSQMNGPMTAQMASQMNGGEPAASGESANFGMSNKID